MMQANFLKNVMLQNLKVVEKKGMVLNLRGRIHFLSDNQPSEAIKDKLTQKAKEQSKCSIFYQRYLCYHCCLNKKLHSLVLIGWASSEPAPAMSKLFSFEVLVQLIGLVSTKWKWILLDYKVGKEEITKLSHPVKNCMSYNVWLYDENNFC